LYGATAEKGRGPKSAAIGEKQPIKGPVQFAWKQPFEGGAVRKA
jgi:hypothetical protein